MLDKTNPFAKHIKGEKDFAKSRACIADDHEHCQGYEFEFCKCDCHKNPAAVALGSLGGRAGRGPSKSRGNAQYYRDLQAKGAAKRREKSK